MDKKIIGAAYTVINDCNETYPINSKIVLIEDDGDDMPAFTLRTDYKQFKKFNEMDWRYVCMEDVSLDEDPESLDEASPIELWKPLEVSVNGITITIPSSTTSITINGKTNAIKIS